MRLSEVADGGTREASATPAYQLHAVLPRRFPHPPSPIPHFSGSGGSTPPPPLTEVTASALVSLPRTTCLFSFVLLDAASNKWVIARLRNLHRLPTALRTRARCCSSRARLALQLLPNPPPPHTHPSCFTRPSLPRVPLGRLCLHPNALRPSAGVPGRLVEPLPP